MEIKENIGNLFHQTAYQWQIVSNLDFHYMHNMSA
jgi:hypothetical protein